MGMFVLPYFLTFAVNGYMQRAAIASSIWVTTIYVNMLTLIFMKYNE